MDISQNPDCRESSHPVTPAWVERVVRVGLRVIGRCTFELLRVLRPIVLPILFWLAVGGIGLWVLFVEVAHDGNFPTARVLSMSLGCLLGAAGYCVLLESLRPTAR